MTNLPAALRERLDERGPVLDACGSSARRTRRDGTVKALFHTHDGRAVEAVLMRYRDGRRSLCVSSQSGCPLTCTFCATGTMKFGRNLTAWEILDQVLHFRRIEDGRPPRVHGHGRADDEPRQRARRRRAGCPTSASRTAARRSRRSAGCRASGGSPSRSCRSASRCRCTRPRTRCARGSCRSTTAIRWPTCSPPARRFYERRRRQVFIEYVMLAGVNDPYAQARAARRSCSTRGSTRST